MRCPDREEMAHLYGKTAHALRHTLRWMEKLRARLHARALSARWRRRVALAVGLGALLVSSTAEHTAPPVALVEAPAPDVLTGDGRADMGQVVPVGRSQVPPEKSAPKDWQRAPCRPGELRVNGMCFAELKEVPDSRGTCRNGLRHEGMCLIPITAKPETPSSIRR